MAPPVEHVVDTAPALEKFDPFELQDTVSGEIRDPYPRMGELRRQAPVHLGPVDLGDGISEVDPTRPPPVTVFGFDEAVQVLRDNETYSSSVYEGIMGLVMGRTILQMDEPEHRVHRALVSPTFRSKVLERWEGDLVQRVVDELISDLLAVDVDGRRLDDEEIFSFLRLLLPAGVETTYRASGNLLYGLLTNPDQLRAVRQDRALLPAAFEETRQSLRFGFGVHVCLGMHLARMETRVAVNALLDRMPDLALDPAPDQDLHIKGMAFRSPIALPVAFTPS